MNFEYSKEQIKSQKEFLQFCQKELLPVSQTLEQKSKEEIPTIIKQNIKKLAEQKYTGLHIFSEYGGEGKSLLEAIPYYHAVARCCPSTFMANEYSAHIVGSLILMAGSDEIKKRYLPELASGNLIASWAISEPEAGEDLTAMKTLAKSQENGWVINGNKCMIANATFADFFLVLANLSTDKDNLRPAFFLIPRQTKGLSIGNPIDKMGLYGLMIADVSLENCFVPNEFLMDQADTNLDLFDTIMTQARIRFATFCNALSYTCMDLSLKHSNQQKRNDKPIFSNQEVSFKLADMKTMIDTATVLTQYSAWLYDKKDKQARSLSSCSKLFSGESATQIGTMALQIFGGTGYLKSSPMERLYRDIRFCELGMGTTEEQRIMIAEDMIKEYI